MLFEIDKYKYYYNYHQTEMKTAQNLPSHKRQAVQRIYLSKLSMKYISNSIYIQITEKQGP